MDPLTPDAGMTEVYAEQSSLGKRDRNDESPEEKSSAAAPGAPEICDNKKAALESATDPKHLGKLTERVPVLLTEAGEPNKSMEIIGASAVQSDGAAAGAAALLGGSTENENAEMIVEMRTEGYTEDEITDLIKQSESAPKQVGLLALVQREKFSIDIFDPDLKEAVGKALLEIAKEENPEICTNENAVSIQIYQLYDTNGNKATVLSAEFENQKLYDFFKDTEFTFRDLNFKATDLKEWFETVNSVKPTGKTFALNIGALPCAPNADSIPQIEPMLRRYGKMTHIVFYADRTVTIGFALGNLPMPIVRKPLYIMHNRVLVGKLDPTHNIRMMGVPCCSFCPGIGDYHTGECAENKAKQKRFLARKQKLNDGKPNMPNPKPVRRGKPAGMREVSRAILKENGQLGQKGVEK